MWTSSFGSLMDIDKLILPGWSGKYSVCFGSLMDIDKLILSAFIMFTPFRFGSLMDIDKLILQGVYSTLCIWFWFSDGY